MNGIRFPLATALVLALGASFAPVAQAAEPEAPDELITRADAVYLTLLDRLNGKGKKDLRLDKAEERGLTEFYANRSHGLLWITENGLNTDRLQALRTTFARAGEWGLNASDYAPADAKGYANHSGYPATWLADAELKTTLAAYTYAKHAQSGRFDPVLVNEFLDKHPEHPEPRTVLKGLATAAAGDKIPAFLESFHPQHDQFNALKTLLAETTSGANSKPEPARAAPKLPDGPSLGPGTSHPHVAILRERLNVAPAKNAPEGVTASEYFDDALADAVRAFQKSKGLGGKGVVNAATREALNRGAVPPAPAARATTGTIIANMERWRWEPRDLGTRYIRVNIPEFMFHLYDRGKLIHEERIVTGKPANMTPIFNNEMQYVVFNPYWNVPESILVKELLPAIQRDPSFIERNRMEIVWQGRPQESFFSSMGEIDPRQVTVRQVPGAGNALGAVKFLFPNKHSVYMHDTPSKDLFNRSMRAFSHGCMRVRNPLKLAEVLLSDQGWDAARVAKAVGKDGTPDNSITLQRKVAMHIQYFTLWVDDTGKLAQYNDVYGHDMRVKVALKLEKTPKVVAEKLDDDVKERGLGN